MTIETCCFGTVKCSMGLIPAEFVVTPEKRVMTEKKPAGNIMDNKLINFMPPVMPFGLCLSLMNPNTLAATMAAGGILTPTPCIASFAAPWLPGSLNVLVGKLPALGMTSQLLCIYMGVVSFIFPGEFTVQVPA